jgi:hypothetical protein
LILSAYINHSAIKFNRAFLTNPVRPVNRGLIDDMGRGLLPPAGWEFGEEIKFGVWHWIRLLKNTPNAKHQSHKNLSKWLFAASVFK